MPAVTDSTTAGADRTLLIYLHGFLSSPRSHKAQLMGAWLTQQRPDIAWRVPALPEEPGVAFEVAVDAVKLALDEGLERIGLIGSSMGGFYATALAESLDLPAVLINPAVRPHRRIDRYYSETINPYSGRRFTLGPRDAADLAAMLPAVLTPSRYWLLLQTADEVLDYREAVAFYAGCRQTVEEGGDHQFQGFERHLPAVVEFLLNRA
jgi:predicted esterase YcpF (UPF0227 family)